MAALVSEYTLEFFTLLNARGKKELIEWCMKEGLIASSYECPKCNEQMGLNERKSVVLDGFEWRCRKKRSSNRTYGYSCQSDNHHPYKCGLSWDPITTIMCYLKLVIRTKPQHLPIYTRAFSADLVILNHGEVTWTTLDHFIRKHKKRILRSGWPSGYGIGLLHRLQNVANP
ncbi:uncharacterized protein TNCV_3782291 [Trichonephila clavipes]|nr:uncharacterized protein TNCV_3782291 [Trichonephila clavipes]